MAETLKLKSLPLRERLHVAQFFVALIDLQSMNADRHREQLKELFTHLELPEADGQKLHASVGSGLDPLDCAKRITRDDVKALLVWDLLILAISDGIYDARDRQALLVVAAALGIPWPAVVEAEAAVANEIRFLESPNSTKSKRRKAAGGKGWKIGLAALGGGTALVVTGGLAAPALGGAIGTYFMGLSGAAAVNAGLAALGGGALAAGGFGMAGGTLVVQGLFGAAGAYAFGKAVATRTGEVEEFAFEHMGGGGLNVVIGISGFLSQHDDFTVTWQPLLTIPDGGDKLALRWESKHLRALGTAFGSLTAKGVAQEGARVWARRGSKTAARALRWPLLVLSAADVISNPWSVARTRAEKTALELAEQLRLRTLGSRPVTLVGFSLGARVILHTLQDLSRTGDVGIIQHAFLLGAAVTRDRDCWRQAQRAVSGRLVNAYSKSDWVLGVLYRGAQWEQPAGLGPVGVPGVEDINVSRLAPGHLDYVPKLESVLAKIHSP